MNRTFSLNNIPDNADGKVDVDISELYLIRQNLEIAMRLVDKQLSQFAAKQHSVAERETEEKVVVTVDTVKETPNINKTPTKTVKVATTKAKSLGICMFVNKRILKERSIGTREDLEGCSQRCQNKAVHLKNGLLICSRHKDSDISKMEEIVNGIKPQILTVDLEGLQMTKTDEGKFDSGIIAEGQYGKPRYSGISDLEDAISECTHLERLLEDSSKVIPCRVGGLKECCLVVHEEVYYVVEPMGECYGKITDKAKIEGFELKMKTKEYFDILGSIERLEGDKDREFLEQHSLIYTREFL